MALKLNGKPLVLRPESPIIGEIKKLLDKAPADELFTVQEVARKLGSGYHYVSDQSNREELAAYTLRVGKVRYWGHPRAIVELKKQVSK